MVFALNISAAVVNLFAQPCLNPFDRNVRGSDCPLIAAYAVIRSGESLLPGNSPGPEDCFFKALVGG